jgi:pantoate--beta-alanine ligase
VQTIRQLNLLRNSIAALRASGGQIALVPTMGALHPGHMALVTRAKTLADHVVVSIFVNPRQFGPSEDLARYPRQEVKDIAVLEASGTSVLWLPSVEEMYPDGYATNVSVTKLGDRLCGTARPGHFDGVATVVSKLFAQVQPNIAIFGEKDWQQLAIIRRMAIDLNHPVEIVGAPTKRDPDGLALSSRNAYLSPEQRLSAVCFPDALKVAIANIEAGCSISEEIEAASARILKGGFESIDYIELVDAASLEPLQSLDREGRMIAAARIGSTRLIDNFPVIPPGQTKK